MRINVKTHKIMKTEIRKRGITFIPINEISEEAKIKLEKMFSDKMERLNKLKEDYKLGKLKIN